MNKRLLVLLTASAIAVAAILFFTFRSSDDCVPCASTQENPLLSLNFLGLDTFYVDDQSQFEGRPTSTKVVSLGGKEYLGMINRYENEIYLRAINPRDSSLDRTIRLEAAGSFEEAEEFEFFAEDSILCYSKNSSKPDIVAKELAFAVFDSSGKWVRAPRYPGLKTAIEENIRTDAAVYPYVDGEAPISMYQDKALITYYSDRTLQSPAPMIGMFSLTQPEVHSTVSTTHPCEYFGSGEEISFLYRNVQTCLLDSQLIVSFAGSPRFFVVNLLDGSEQSYCSVSNYFSLTDPPEYNQDDIDYNDKASLLQKFGRYGRFVSLPNTDYVVRIVFPPINENVGPYEHYQKRKASLIVFDRSTFSILGETDLTQGRGWDDWGIVANPKGKLYILDAYRSKQEEFTKFGALVYKSYTLHITK